MVEAIFVSYFHREEITNRGCPFLDLIRRNMGLMKASKFEYRRG